MPKKMQINFAKNRNSGKKFKKKNEKQAKN